MYGGIILGILSVVLGIFGYRRIRHNQATNDKIAIAGIVLGAIGPLAGIVIGVQGLSFALSPLTGRWRTLRHITASPSKIGDITKAALVLTHYEHARLPQIR